MLLGQRWALAILGVLEIGPRRFNELNRLVLGCSKRMLSATLVELADAGLVSRIDSSGVGPLCVTYSVTDEAVAVMGWSNQAPLPRAHPGNPIGKVD